MSFSTSVIEYDYVNLSLPSGTCWASCNVGARAPEELGTGMTFGETRQLKVELPTVAQLMELISHTESETCELNGVMGRRFFRSGNGIFLPFAEKGDPGFGSYWSGMLNENFSYFAYYLGISSDWVYCGNSSLDRRRLVRAVQVPELPF